MASRNQNSSPDVESTTSALEHAHQHPTLRAANSYPPPPPKPRGGFTGRRVKPNFKLSDIDDIFTPMGGGAIGAGLGAGRPQLAETPPRRPNAGNFGSPFSNFEKIV
jgi:mitogen-activated protein kinase kinase